MKLKRFLLRHFPPGEADFDKLGPERARLRWSVVLRGVSSSRTPTETEIGFFIVLPLPGLGLEYVQGSDTKMKMIDLLDLNTR